MTTVTTVGMVAGAALIATVVIVFLLKKEFSSGGAGVTAIGLVLIGMSQWSSIKITAAGTSLELLKETAQAAEQVATQAEQAATAVETTRQQVATLVQQLETRNVLPGPTLRAIRSNLEGAPRVDANALQRARATLGRISRPQ